jgi:gas vesicle protein
MSIPVVFETNCDPVIVGGAFAVGGAIVGAVIAAVSAYIVARRNEDAARKESERKERLELKKAAQLVGAEFLTGSTGAETMIQKKRWISILPLTVSAWETYSGPLSQALSEDDFFKVYQASNALKGLIDIWKKANNAPNATFDEQVESFVKPMQDEMFNAALILQKLSRSITRTQIP